MSLHDITSRIAKAETDAGRTPSSVELIAVMLSTYPAIAHTQGPTSPKPKPTQAARRAASS